MLHRRRRLRRPIAGISEVIDGLDLPSPWDLHEFLHRWDAERGRTTLLLPLHARTGMPSGLLFSPPGGLTDYIWHVDTSPLHRDHIVMHEVGHLLFGHAPNYESEPEVLAQIMAATMQHLGTDIARLMLGARTGFVSHDEQEAERFAGLVLARAGARSAPPDESMSTLHATWGSG